MVRVAVKHCDADVTLAHPLEKPGKKFVKILGILCAAALLMAAGGARAVPPQGLGAFDKSECKTFAESFYRLAGLRNGGAGKALAVQNVTEWLTQQGRTGSHVRGRDLRGSVNSFADYVYAHRDYDGGLLYVHGLYHCALARSSTSEAQFDAGIRRLEDVTVICRKKFDEKEGRKQLGQCIEAGMEPATASAQALPSER